LSNPNAQGDIPLVVLVYKLWDIADTNTLDACYNTHSIPAYAISLNLPTCKLVSKPASALLSSAPDTLAARSTNIASRNNSSIHFTSQYTVHQSETPKLLPSTKPTLCSVQTPYPSPSGDHLIYAGKKKYKPVAKKVKPVGTTLPEEFCIIRNIQGDPLADLPILSPHPINFTPTSQYKQASFDIIKKNHPHGFLTTEEQKFMHHFMMIHQDGFAWNKEQKGSFCKDFFPPVHIPITEHIPWVLKNMPIPPGIYNTVLDVVCKRIAAGVYEQSNSLYCSCWFTVLCKGGGKVHIVHDLQPLNTVTIRDAGVPPHTEQLAKNCSSRASYGLLDLFVGYDERTLATESCNLTTFQTPLGTLCLTCVPMGWSNSAPIFHGNITYTLQDEIPDVTIPFLDNAPIKGLLMRYELPNGLYKTHPNNPGIRHFVWEHFQSVNHIVQHIKYVGCTWSGPKAFLCIPETLVVGHMCYYKGRCAADSKVDKICNWGPCTNFSEVHPFLGTAGLMCIFIKNFSYITQPLTRLTQKDTEFIFGSEEIAAQEKLKDTIVKSPTIHAINYTAVTGPTPTNKKLWQQHTPHCLY
jgi:hypothetical protein